MNNTLKLGVVAFGAGLIFGMPTLAVAQEQEQATEVVAEANQNERICRRVQVTGTRIPQRVCMSRGEWTELSEESVEDFREGRDNQGNSTVAD